MNIAIIGGGAAGMTAASRVKALRPDWNVMVFEKTNFVSHAPCGIPFYVSGIVEYFEELCTYDVAYFRSERGIDVHTNARVIEVGDGYLVAEENGRERKYEWDKLLFATGSRAKRLNVKYEELEGVLCVNDITNAEKVKKWALKAENVVIIGSGYIGVEMAEAMTRLGKKVTVVEMAERPLPEYDAEIAAVLKTEMEKFVNLRLGERVVAFEGKDKVEKVITNKAEYRCDMAIVAVGVHPNTEIARNFVELGKSGAIKTNSRMETSRENVYAAGDCAESINVVTGKSDWIPLAAPANKMGYVAGVNMAGYELHYPGSLKSQITSFYELEIGKAGLSEHEAIREGYEVISAFVTTKSNARYFINGLVHLKAVADRSGKLLGIQAVGKGVAMRIYAASALLYRGANVRDLFFTDFPYYPPVSRVWDPLVVAARNLFRKLGIP
ncbi:MAG: CoA-disulfide reductase [Archaeoglobi archaeon]|nr:MAG: CoA-disulfide reductase [Archaeoglobi archaeon]TDA29066.1 MAG: CoA-disulfide reductase [Archaeoglobi archaeon]